MKDVFISYKSEEFSEAKWVKTTLEENGISCWMAPDDIPGGSSYAAEILQAIRGAKFFVLVLSEAAQTSTHIAKELDIAINNHMTVLPFMLENCELKDDFFYYLSNVQRYPAYENKKKAINRMIAEIRQAIPSEPTADAATQETTTDKQPAERKANVQQPSREKQPKPKKEKALRAHKPKTRQQKDEADDDKKKKSLKIVGIILAVIGLLIIFGVAVSEANKVEICGEKYKKSSTYLSIEGATLNAKDMENIRKLEDLHTLRLPNCAFNAGVKQELLSNLPYSTVQLSGCGLTDEDLNNAAFSDSLNLLDISDNAVSSLDFLKDYAPHLSQLNIDNTDITDISVLSEAVSLEELHAVGNGISDISALRNCVKLTSLILPNNNLRTLTGLEYALDLQELYVQNNQLDNLEGIANCTLLKDVNICGNNLHDSDLEIIAKSAEKLMELNAEDNCFVSTTPLVSCKHIMELSLDYNQLETLEGLENMSILSDFSASHNKITDISALEKCPMLSSLNLADNSITDIGTLSFSSDAADIDVDFRHNNITSFATLPTEPHYTTLVLYDNPVGDYTSLAGLNIRHLYIDYNEATDYSQFNTDIERTVTVHLVNTPLDKQKLIEEQIGVYYVEFTSAEELEAEN